MAKICIKKATTKCEMDDFVRCTAPQKLDTKLLGCFL